MRRPRNFRLSLDSSGPMRASLVAGCPSSTASPPRLAAEGIATIRTCADAFGPSPASDSVFVLVGADWSRLPPAKDF